MNKTLVQTRQTLVNTINNNLDVELQTRLTQRARNVVPTWMLVLNLLRQASTGPDRKEQDLKNSLTAQDLWVKINVEQKYSVSLTSVRVMLNVLQLKNIDRALASDRRLIGQEAASRARALGGVTFIRTGKTYRYHLGKRESDKIVETKKQDQREFAYSYDYPSQSTASA